MEQPPQKKLLKRKQLLAAAVDGTMSQFFKNHSLAVFSSDLSSKQQKRLNSSLDQKITIIPKSRGIYHCFSRSSGKSYMLSLHPHTCTCSDFLYTCDYTNGEVCKHLWKLKSLIEIEAIPQNTQLPKLWTLSRLNQDISYATKTNNLQLKEELEQLRETVEQTKWYHINYIRIYSYWYKLFTEHIE